jgi:transposase
MSKTLPSKTSTRYSPESQERAVRMVFEAKEQYPSQWAAIESIAAKIGCKAETLRRWVRRAERDSGQRPGPTTADQARVRELEREVRELRKANEILKLASAFSPRQNSTAA